MLVFAQESLSDVWDECLPLFHCHYTELNKNKDIVLDPDEASYRVLESVNILKVYTARLEGILVGYCFFIIMPHLHYKQSLTAQNDILYLHPKVRKGLNGYRFIKYVLTKLKELKPQRIFFHVKASVNFGPMLERLGAKVFETIYSITLRDE